METYTIRYSPESINDLKNIYTYISSELLSPDYAKGQVNRIRQAIHSLDFMPKRHPIVEWEPWFSMDMRFLPVDNFIVYYLVNSDDLTISIVRIFYSGHDIENSINTNR